jgi:hypothetical protein
MNGYKIKNIEQLISFADEYYDTKYQSVVLKAVGNFLNTIVVVITDETKESFIDKIWGFYEYCLTSDHTPKWLMKNPDDENEIIQVIEAYY